MLLLYSTLFQLNCSNLNWGICFFLILLPCHQGQWGSEQVAAWTQLPAGVKPWHCHSQSPILLFLTEHRSHSCPMAGMSGVGAPSLTLRSPATACAGTHSTSDYPLSIYSLHPQTSRKETCKKKHIAGEPLFCKSLPLDHQLEILRDLICLSFSGWLWELPANDATSEVLIILAGKTLKVFVVVIFLVYIPYSKLTYLPIDATHLWQLGHSWLLPGSDNRSLSEWCSQNIISQLQACPTFFLLNLANLHLAISKKLGFFPKETP